MMDEDGAGHDVHFFRRAKRAGYQLHVDTGCVCGHFMEHELRIEDYYRWREEHSEEIIYP